MWVYTNFFICIVLYLKKKGSTYDTFAKHCGGSWKKVGNCNKMKWQFVMANYEIDEIRAIMQCLIRTKVQVLSDSYRQMRTGTCSWWIVYSVDKLWICVDLPNYRKIPFCLQKRVDRKVVHTSTNRKTWKSVCHHLACLQQITIKHVQDKI